MSQLFGEKRLFLGTNATETAFKAEPLADFEIIHIAAHGIASAKFPDRAALVLENDPKSGEDGSLQVREIRDLNLAADLVTLSPATPALGPWRVKRVSPTSSARSSLPGRSQWLRAFGLRATFTRST